MADIIHASPDGHLRFLVRSCNDDITVGFADTPWHTHGDLLAAEAEVPTSPYEAVESFIEKLVNNQLIIAVSTIGGKVRDIWITDDPVAALRYRQSDEIMDFRLWDGTKIPA
ncbi:hypothetical protein [Oleomonas cavernae]|uniref:hypothetical protein n=1 Tax=Oleomonas cavernae TaxID=2320859 RepID=UPI0011C3A3C2|nr:hypothetical protein [Oleomonas cavernae]